MPRMTLRAYARHRGCALSTVQAAITRGRIVVGKKDGLVDSVVADRTWEERTDKTRTRRAEPQGDASKRTGDARSGEAARAPGADAAFWKARTAREVFAARRAEIELGQLAGVMLPRAEFDRAGARAGRLFHDALVDFGDRFGPVVCGMKPEEAINFLNQQCAIILDGIASARGQDEKPK